MEVEKGKFNSSGADSIRFLCSFNKNQELRPIEEIASGGEISRVMLAIKYLLAKKISLPTIIFDEIDSGVSGEIADRMGTMMREMGKEMQVIAITHLPQIASKGLTHFKVYKKDNSDSTLSYIERLDGDHRVRELAVMLSGRVVDEASLRNAESLLNQSR